MNLVTHVGALLVKFKKPIFDDDFVEKGMIAWLTDVEWDSDSYKLYFYFGEHEEENKKYFKRSYYTKEKGVLVTALEKGDYDPYYSVFFSMYDNERNDLTLVDELEEYLIFLGEEK